MLKTMKRLHTFPLWLAALCCLLMTGCRNDVPDSFTRQERQPKIFPDYCDVTIPSNIAPLSFMIREEGADFVTRYACGDEEIVCSGPKAMPSVDDWHDLLDEAKGKDITVEVYARNNGGTWTQYRPFALHVATEPIDEYLSYRLIAPSYVTYESLTINQRNLTNYDESEIYNNMLASEGEDGQCINCHSYQNYSTKNMQFHARQTHGGTMLVVDGEPKKIDLKTDSTLSGGVYPAWHPTQKVIAYSVNITGQSFHTKDPEKVEVQDSHSDLILYDIEANTVQKIADEPDELETYPSWSPDGNYLYFCSARYHYDEEKGGDRALMDAYRSIRYNLYRMPYDQNTKTFGPRELVFDADTLGKSATLPRISPDGRWLVFSLGDYGCFHIWHKSSDLWIMDLGTDAAHQDLAAARRTAHKMGNINSDDVESYHSWSSNGRWMVVSSRRIDGSYTRPFIAYVDKEGKARKPFVLPQEDPEFYYDFYRSYNIPEFMREPVTISPQHFARVFKGEALKATFRK